MFFILFMFLSRGKEGGHHCLHERIVNLAVCVWYVCVKCVRDGVERVYGGD